MIVVIAAGLLFATAFSARIVVNDPDALLANFYVVPIALLAIEFGVTGGVIGATVGFALVPAWSVINTVHIAALGYISRGAVMFVTGVVVGRFSDRLRSDIAERQEAQRDLTLYADQLEGSIRGLARSVERLEAFAEIARAVGGETELERVLALIVDHGRGHRRRAHAGRVSARGKRAGGGQWQRPGRGAAATAARRGLARRRGADAWSAAPGR